MSCNGCRVLRKGCSETCILRPCLQWIESAEAQGHATVFVAKFFGRAGLMSFISAVPELHRAALFQSLLFEACGRTVNPVNGAVGMLWTGNWKVCQAAVETVLRGGTLRPISDLIESNVSSDESNQNHHCRRFSTSRSKTEMKESPSKRLKSNRFGSDLDLQLNHGLALTAPVITASFLPPLPAFWDDRPRSPSEESVTTSCLENGIRCDKYETNKKEKKLLNLFV